MKQSIIEKAKRLLGGGVRGSVAAFIAMALALPQAAQAGQTQLTQDEVASGSVRKEGTLTSSDYVSQGGRTGYVHHYTFRAAASGTATIQNVSPNDRSVMFSIAKVGDTSAGQGTLSMSITQGQDYSVDVGSQTSGKSYKFELILPTSVTTYTVTFNANGGSTSESTRRVVSGQSVETLPTASRSGYSFGGWWTSSSGGSQITSSTKVNANVTYYAHWSSNPAPTPTNNYTLRFDANGGTIPGYGSTRSVTVTYGSRNYYSTSGATRSGYSFQGWFTSGGTQVYNSAGRCVAGTYWNYSNQWQYRGNLTVYARWTANQTNNYTLRFDANGGTIPGYGSTRSVTVTYGSRNYYSTAGARRSGYAFQGWYTSGGTQVYNAAGRCVAGTYWNYSNQWQYRGNLTVYARWQWIGSSYTLRFDANGGTIPGYGSTRSVTVTYGSKNYYSTSGATRSGYAFQGWFTSGGTQVYNSAGRCVVGTYWNSSYQWQYYGDVTLYAHWQWRGSNYTVTFNANGGTIVGTGLTSRSVTVTYGSRNYYSVPRAQRSGCTFAGWYVVIDSSATQVYDKNGQAVKNSTYWNSNQQWQYSGSITVKAMWTPCDNMADISLLYAGSSGTITASNVGATSEYGQPSYMTSSTVWLDWKAPSSGYVTFNTIGSSFDTKLGAYTGSYVSSLTAVAEDDDSGGGRASLIRFYATSGTRYHIGICGYKGAAGTFKLSWYY